MVDPLRKAALGPETSVSDATDRDSSPPLVRYDITSYGIDYDVEGIVRRLQRGEIFMPPYQRSFVWARRVASRFIESLILGLPVPGVFLAHDPVTSRLTVIDGQQRLRSLQFYYQEEFEPASTDRARSRFGLTGVHPRLLNRSYLGLDEADRLNLDNAVIHATIVRQESPPDDDTSVFQIFERLNSGGTLLRAQEMRRALYAGPLLDRIQELNNDQDWRAVFGRPHSRLKDQEPILRFLALFFSRDTYRRPMADFLSRFAKAHRSGPAEFLEDAASLFLRTIRTFNQAKGARSFRLDRSLNAAVFDSMSVGLATRLHQSDFVPDPAAVATVHDHLLAEHEYHLAVSRSTADEAFLRVRVEQAIAAFSAM